MAQAHPDPSVEGIVAALEGRGLEVHYTAEEMLAGLMSEVGDPDRLGDDATAMANLGVLVDEVSRTARLEEVQMVDVEVMRRTLLRICPLPPWCR
jgi:hypothetical protein